MSLFKARRRNPLYHLGSCEPFYSLFDVLGDFVRVLEQRFQSLLCHFLFRPPIFHAAMPSSRDNLENDRLLPGGFSASSYDSIPGIRLSPIPHLILPEPFGAFCVTPLLLTDAPQLPRIFNHPDSQQFGYRDTPDGVMTEESAISWVEKRQDVGKGYFQLMGTSE